MLSRIFTILSLAITTLTVLNKVDANEVFDLTCDNWDDNCPDNLVIVDCFQDFCLADAEGNKPCEDDKVCRMNHCGACHTICCDPVVCENECAECEDGSVVVPDPENDCKCPACVKPPCDTQQLLCRDGYQWVSRNPENDCEFDACPDSYEPTCTSFVEADEECPEGVPRFDDCLYDPCDDAGCSGKDTCLTDTCGGCHSICCSPQEMLVCQTDSFTCPGGAELARDPKLDCGYPDCPDVNKPEPSTFQQVILLIVTLMIRTSRSMFVFP